MVQPCGELKAEEVFDYHVLILSQFRVSLILHLQHNDNHIWQSHYNTLSWPLQEETQDIWNVVSLSNISGNHPVTACPVHVICTLYVCNGLPTSALPTICGRTALISYTHQYGPSTTSGIQLPAPYLWVKRMQKKKLSSYCVQQLVPQPGLGMGNALS